MADKRISQLVDRGTIANNDVVPIVVSGATTTNKATISSIQTFMQGNLDLGVTSVGLSMPSAFVVTNSPVTASGNISVTGAGTVSQYIRGDGSLADFPQSGGGGGASVNYYLNGSVSQGTIGGIAFLELSKTPILGGGTDFTINADGYIASFITDAGDPALLEIPAGNWNFETYFQASSGGGSPTFYVELYKVDSGGTATLIASNSGTPELIAFGTTTTPYFSTLAVPTTSLTLTDRLAIRYYVAHSGRTITLHTENATLCQIITTFTTGLTALNGLTAQVQNFATGTSGTDFGISSTGSTHTFNLPTASATNRGALSSADFTTFNSKIGGTLATGQVAFGTAANTVGGDNGLFWNNANGRLGIGTNAPSQSIQTAGSISLGDRDVNTIRSIGYTAFNTFGGASAQIGFVSQGASINGLDFRISGAYGIRIFSGASELYRFDNIGRLGILTTSPTQSLDVNGTGRIRNGVSLADTSGNVLIGTTTDAGFRLDVNGTARVQGALTINNSSSNSQLIIESNRPTGANNFLGINFRNTNSTSNKVSFTIGGGTIASGESRTFSFGTDINAAGVRDFFIYNGSTTNTPFIVTPNDRVIIGNTGIAYTDAGFRLDVNGTARITGTVANALTIERTSTLSNVYIRYQNATASWYAGQTDAGTFGIGTSVALGADTLFNLTTGGNLLLGSVSNTGQRLQVTGSTLLNGLSTIQGTTASDTAPLGSELATTGTGTNWTGTDFATGYTHTIGSTAALTTTLAAVVSTFYQITYTVTGRTTGSFVINYGGTSSPALTATGAFGPRATSTATLEIVPTTDFNGTIVLSVRTISTSSASVTLNRSDGTVTNQIRISSINTNTIVGRDSGTRNTTGNANSFFGATSGRDNTTGIQNSFFGVSAGASNTSGNFNSFIGVNAGLFNTSGSSNSFFGVGSGQANTTGGSNSFFGSNSGFNNTIGNQNSFFGVGSGSSNTTGTFNSFFGISSGGQNTTGTSNSFFGGNSGFVNTTGSSNSFFGVGSGSSNTTGASNSFFGDTSGQFNTTGSNNVFNGRQSGRLISGGGNLNIANNSVFIGFDTRAAADNQTNQIVIGHTAIGLGSNTTVLGNSSTTFGRWFGNLLIGTSTNNGTNLRVVGTTQSDIITQNLASHGKKVLQYSTTSSTTINLPTEFPLMTGLVVANAYAVFGKFLGKYITYGQAIEFYISKNPNGTWNAVAYSDSSQFVASLVSVTGSGNDITITTQTDTSFILELTVMTQA